MTLVMNGIKIIVALLFLMMILTAIDQFFDDSDNKIFLNTMCILMYILAFGGLMLFVITVMLNEAQNGVWF